VCIELKLPRSEKKESFQNTASIKACLYTMGYVYPEIDYRVTWRNSYLGRTVNLRDTVSQRGTVTQRGTDTWREIVIWRDH
jgi:hypothetical protein